MQYFLEKNVMRINGDFSRALDPLFDAHIEKLLEVEGAEMVLDLTEVEYMSSSYLGCLASLAVKARRREKNLTVQATSEVVGLMEMVGLGQLVKIEEFEE